MYDSLGVYDSYGLKKSQGAAHEIFSPMKDETFKIFGKEVLSERFNEAMGKIRQLSGEWFPQANNVFKLYDQYGKIWQKTPCDKIRGNTDLDWSGMPAELKAYIQGLPEYDADIFSEITGLK